MKFTYNWLRAHYATDLDPVRIGERLTMLGLELEQLTDLNQGLSQVYVGHIERIDPHPQADRLTVCQVRVGGELHQIVCGATNHHPGAKVAVARPGARLAGGLEITPATIRGVSSAGMLCSLKELGLADSADGIWLLPPAAREGLPLVTLLARDDHLFEVNVTPNRGDWLGVRGIARDLAAALGGELLPLRTDLISEITVGQGAEVAITDGIGCPRYGGRVMRGVRVGPSPDWLRQRLELVGVRSINNVVDVTNFVMLELGHPMHAFDLEKLAFPIVVRRAHPGERLVTLDQVERELDPEMTVIADQRQALALGGIIGGAASAISDTTVDLFLEAAYFDPVRIARCGRKLGIITDSRFRFERGVNPEGITLTLDLAASLIQQVAGGVAGAVMLRDAGTWQPAAPIALDYQRIADLSGVAFTPERIAGYLTALGCKVTTDGAGQAKVQPPAFRPDLRRLEDLLEEVVRLYGYDRVPEVAPRHSGEVAVVPPQQGWVQRVRRAVAGMGYLEAVNYAMVGVELARRFAPEAAPVALLNPLSEELAALRTSLSAGLVECARRNLARGNSRLRLMELGRVFLPEADGTVTEQERVALLLAGEATARSWHTPARAVDFFDLKGDLERLFASLGWSGIRFESAGPEVLHPGRRAVIRLGGDQVMVGWCGQLHPEAASALGVEAPLWIAELLLEPLSRVQAEPPPQASRYPAVSRDFAFEVPLGVTAQAVMDVARGVDPLIREVTIFDVYQGSHVRSGYKSLAVGVTLQSLERSLRDAECAALAERIVAEMAARCGAALRGG